MSSNIALSVRGLGKSYTIAHNRQKVSTMAEAIATRIKNPVQKVTRETFWALSDVSYDVQVGEVVGILGRNGAGKSTMLKVLGQITAPTKGTISLYGRVGSLLEVGTGFHPELTGRENIFLNGAILGMRQKEIAKQFDAIVDFAGVEQFLDTPVKRYSSGMYVRLAFAVAAHLRSDILIVDEVLAVGDSQFQNKCLGKMKDVSADGRTVLFVSHHMGSLTSLCTRGVMLKKGTLVDDGPIIDVVERYMKSFAEISDQPVEAERRGGSGEFRFTTVTPLKESFRCNEDKVFEFHMKKERPIHGDLSVVGYLVDSRGNVISRFDSRLMDIWFRNDENAGRLTIKTPWLKPGTYFLDMFITTPKVLDEWRQACFFHVIPPLPYPASSNENATEIGLTLMDFGMEEIPVGELHTAPVVAK